ncbi:ABC transporter ATP-binding protein [Mycoplasma todarodis]|uniref:Peptide ABC transporter ATP-binding protein n=1 Tax=Mycoplasma todarodis TaxID=1937191 RepID=A0A4R0XJV0_9MOLU|nr:ABC transporter ATP-binding protein [Mycoplasma todarodis]TCG10926.1 peptide ABC transporter ATP-binding protein [Mycoplasma todarodis]
MENIISVRNLEVSFKSPTNKKELMRIIRGVDFDIPKGSIVGFIGESGSGKSVTAKTLLKMNSNSTTMASSILIDGVNVLEGENPSTTVLDEKIRTAETNLKKAKKDDKKKEIKKSLRKLKNEKHSHTTNRDSFKMTDNKKIWRDIRGKKVAYIPQDSMTSLNPTKTIGKQIMESLELHSDLKTTKERKERAIELLERFGVKGARERIDSYPHEFSGGMRQRVIIAMTVACMPDVIIADEPTTALDPTVQASVLELFEEVRREFNISIIFISHDIAVIATLCDYIYVFYAGKVVEKGKTEELFSDPRHPYTWSLMAAMPDPDHKSDRLFTIPGTPPNFTNLPEGDPFSVRNPFALKIDFLKEPPLFRVKDDHFAATWLLHPSSPEVNPPEEVTVIMERARETLKELKGEKHVK